jgi:replication factor C small subunit
MLWTERYRPAHLDQITGQEKVVRQLSSFVKSGTVPHLMIAGPHGSGKSAAIECFAKELYGGNWEMNTSVFATADLFSQGKKFLEGNERYAHLYQKDLSLIANFKYILKWYASMRPLDADFKLMVFEDAHALTRDAQQGLRRVMERYSKTCRFVFSTTNQSAIIPAIASRCLPLFFSPVRVDVMIRYLTMIGENERSGTFPCSGDDIELITQVSQGDLREAILLLQIAMESGQCRNLTGIAGSETRTVASSALQLIRKGDTQGATRQLESLMIDYGLSGPEVLSDIRRATQRDYNHPLLAIALAEADERIGHCNNEYLQIAAFANSIREVFP